MRSIIVDLVRQRQVERHGGGALHLSLTDDVMEQTALPVGEEHILRVHEALDELAKVDARMAQMVEMRHCAGLNAIAASASTLIGEDLCGGLNEPPPCPAPEWPRPSPRRSTRRPASRRPAPPV